MSSLRYSRRTETNGFGEWLRQMRKDQGLPMRKVAAAADMDQALLCKVEGGQRLVTEEVLCAVKCFFM